MFYESNILYVAAREKERGNFERITGFIGLVLIFGHGQIRICPYYSIS